MVPRAGVEGTARRARRETAAHRGAATGGEASHKASSLVGPAVALGHRGGGCGDRHRGLDRGAEAPAKGGDRRRATRGGPASGGRAGSAAGLITRLPKANSQSQAHGNEAGEGHQERGEACFGGCAGDRRRAGTGGCAAEGSYPASAPIVSTARRRAASPSAGPNTAAASAAGRPSLRFATGRPAGGRGADAERGTRRSLRHGEAGCGALCFRLLN